MYTVYLQNGIFLHSWEPRVQCSIHCSNVWSFGSDGAAVFSQLNFKRSFDFDLSLGCVGLGFSLLHCHGFEQVQMLRTATLQTPRPFNHINCLGQGQGGQSRWGHLPSWRQTGNHYRNTLTHTHTSSFGFQTA